MLSVPKGEFAITRLSIGIVLLLFALTFYYFTVLKVDYYKTGLLDLGWSDSSGYFAQAKAMMKDGYPYLNFGYKKLPSMWPSGYPALMLPWLKILPEADSILAPFRTNQTVGLFLLLVTFGFYMYLKTPLTGGFAALLLATLPGFFTFCRSSLSEISASALIALAFMFTYLGLKEERRWKIYLSGDFSWPFTERAHAIILLRTAVAGHGSLPSSGKTPALASPLLCSYDRLRSGG
jgi:hypothetical protein